MLRAAATSGALRTATRAASRRHLAIAATVKKATDTSAQEFSAPSHVSVAAEAASIARQYRDFYSNPDSTLKLSEEARAALNAEVAKRAMAIPGSDIDKSWIASNIDVPEQLRLGDNPIFKHRN